MPNSEMIAPTMKAVPTPDAVATCTPRAPEPSTAVAAPIVSSVTKRAVPAAPASCCAVPSTALPCEYSFGGSPPSAAVNSGVKVRARPMLSTTWAPRTNHTLVSTPTVESAQSTALTMIDPGMSSTRGPRRS
jgi:hypothetical protein